MHTVLVYNGNQLESSCWALGGQRLCLKQYKKCGKKKQQIIDVVDKRHIGAGSEMIMRLLPYPVGTVTNTSLPLSAPSTASNCSALIAL